MHYPTAPAKKCADPGQLTGPAQNVTACSGGVAEQCHGVGPHQVTREENHGLALADSLIALDDAFVIEGRRHHDRSAITTSADRLPAHAALTHGAGAYRVAVGWEAVATADVEWKRHWSAFHPLTMDGPQVRELARVLLCRDAGRLFAIRVDINHFASTKMRAAAVWVRRMLREQVHVAHAATFAGLRFGPPGIMSSSRTAPAVKATTSRMRASGTPPESLAHCETALVVMPK